MCGTSFDEITISGVCSFLQTLHNIFFTQNTKKKNRYDEETRTWIESLSDDIDVDRFVDALTFVARHIVIIRVESMNHLIRTSMFISPPLHTHVLTR